MDNARMTQEESELVDLLIETLEAQGIEDIPGWILGAISTAE
jgi:hypothetical protein